MDKQLFFKLNLWLFIITLGVFSHGQSPGGLTQNPQVWLKADNATTATWTDSSPNGLNAPGRASSAGGATGSLMNFNPTIPFAGVSFDEAYDIPAAALDPGNTSHVIIGVGSGNGGTFMTGGNGVPFQSIFVRNSAGTASYDWHSDDLLRTGVTTDARIMIAEYDAATTTKSLIFNGDTPTTNVANALNLVPTTYIIGHDGGNGANIYSGDLAEIIVYKSYNFTSADYRKVQSYLALKYGITLDQTSPQNYVNSDDVTIWNAASNPSHNKDVFGIGKDMASGLDQRVAKSNNTGAILTIALDNNFVLANNDAGRTTAHTNDKQFLLFSNNGSGVELNATAEVIAGTYNIRTPREWRVNATNFSQSINLKLDGLGSTPGTTIYLVKDGDGDFSSGATTVGALDANGEITGVTLADGEYITAMALQVAPGGVPGMELWVNANLETTGNLVNGTGLTDRSQRGNTLEHVNGTPEVQDNMLNFNKGISFDGLTDFVRNDDGDFVDNNIAGDVFSVVKENTANGFETGFPYSLDNHASAHYTYTDQRIYVVYGTTDDYAWSPLDGSISGISGWSTKAGVSAISNTGVNVKDWNVFNTHAAENDWAVGFNGLTQVTASVNTISFDNPGIKEHIGARPGQVWHGDIPELVAYDRILSATEKQQVNSYLGLKYGLTLGVDYIASNGTMFWNLAANAGYTNDVFGIGRDDASGLNQKVSKTINGDSALIVALDNNFTASNSDAARTTTHTNDRQFLMLGSNNATMATQTTELDLTNYSVRVGREWRVSTTNFSQTVNLKFDLQGVDSPESWIYYVLKDADGDFSSGATELGVLDTNGELQGATLADGDHLTIAVFTPTPGGVGTGILAWYRADIGYTQASGVWKDQSINNRDATKETARGGISPAQTDNYLNFNPIIDFNGADMFALDNAMYPLGTFTYETAFLSHTASGSIWSNDQSNAGCSDNPGLYADGYVDTDNFGTANDLNPMIDTTNPRLLNITRDGTGTTSLYTEGKFEASQVIANPISVDFAWHRLGGRHDNNCVYSPNDAAKLGEAIFFFSPLTATERTQVNTYLTLKYGLELDQTVATNYLASDGSIVWNVITNTGHNNDIFGIARDDKSSFDQRISKSSNTDAIVTMALDNNFTTANIDASRTTSHNTSLQYLILGNDNGATILDQTTELPTGVYDVRIAREWKIQASNFSQTINMKFTGFESANTTTYYIMKDADGDFSTGATQIGALDSNGEITGVTLANGEYITVVADYKAPGGVIDNLSLWLRADDGTSTTTDGANISGWSDQTTSSNTFSEANPVFQPTYSASMVFNFNPAVDFAGDEVLYGTQNLGTGTNIQFDFIAVTNLDGITGYDGIGFVGTRNSTTDGVSVNYRDSDNKLAIAQGNPADDLGSTSSSQGTTPVIANGGYTGPGFRAAINGEVFTTNTGSANISNQTFRIGEGRGDGEFLNGRIAEVIGYSSNNGAADRNKIESYLAVKYGITLNQIVATNYVASDGSIIWDATVNTGFNNDIFGIGQDVNSILDQRVSKSVNSGVITTIALDNNFTVLNNDVSRTTTHTNSLQFILLSNNGGATTTQTTEMNAVAYTERVTREWRISATNFAQAINMKFDGFNTMYSVIVDADGDFSTGATILGNLDANGEVTGITLTNNTYITLAKRNTTDTDGDGIQDWADADVNGDGTVDNGTDTDGDGITNAAEILTGTNPNNVDSDNDEIPDGADVNSGANSNADTDGDGIQDGADVNHTTATNNADADLDGIINIVDPYDNTSSVDTDGDGIPDAADVDPTGTGTPLNGMDSDGDGIHDAADADDSPSDGSTDTGNTDSDGDGIDDAFDPNTLNTNEYDIIKNQITLYPNPANEFVTIKFSRNLNDVKIFIYDINGRLVLKNLTSTINNKKLDINISHLEAGAYIMKIKVNNSIVGKQLLIE